MQMREFVPRAVQRFFITRLPRSTSRLAPVGKTSGNFALEVAVGRIHVRELQAGRVARLKDA
jgi:hypothetical protein